MSGKLHKLVLAGLASIVLMGPFASGANAEQRNGKMLPSRQMMRSHAMHHSMMHRHRMMRRHTMRHHRAM